MARTDGRAPSDTDLRLSRSGFANMEASAQRMLECPQPAIDTSGSRASTRSASELHNGPRIISFHDSGFAVKFCSVISRDEPSGCVGPRPSFKTSRAYLRREHTLFVSIKSVVSARFLEQLRIGPVSPRTLLRRRSFRDGNMEWSESCLLRSKCDGATAR
jgi:hypothetical protein